jgi:hypothetical protein
MPRADLPDPRAPTDERRRATSDTERISRAVSLSPGRRGQWAGQWFPACRAVGGVMAGLSQVPGSAASTCASRPAMRLSRKRLLERAACRRSSRVRCPAVRSRMRCLSVAFSALSRLVALLSRSCSLSRSWPSSSPVRVRWARISACAALRAPRLHGRDVHPRHERVTSQARSVWEARRTSQTPGRPLGKGWLQAGWGSWAYPGSGV